MQSIYMEWYSSEVIPPARPVLLIKDGHAFHISNRVLELTCENNIHSSCPYLQPQDIGGIQCNSMQFACCNYSKACCKSSIAGLVVKVWLYSFTLLQVDLRKVESNLLTLYK